MGIAADPDGSACYIADASTGRVVKIPAGAGGGSAIKDTWGGRTYTFPDPCGMDVNVGHQVAVAHANGYIYYIYAQSGWATYGYAGGQVHSMHFDRDYADTYDTFLFWSNERAMAEAFNQNDIGPNPPRYHGGIVFGLQSGYVALDPDWYFYVYRHFPQRVVLNNGGQSQDYPSAYPHADRIIEMKVAGWAGRKVQLRVTDPPDLPPYAPDGGCLQGGCSPALPYEANDNLGTADYGVGLQPDGSDAQVSNTFTIGADGTFTFYLKVPARYSGDNVQVEVTKCDHAGNVLPHRVAGLSAVYTSWKRVFVERDRMFRRGGVLAASYDHATAEPKNRIRLWNWTNIQPGDQVVLFQADRPADSPAAERAAVKDPILDAGDGKTVWVDLDLGVDGQGSPNYLQQDYTASIHPTTGDLDFGYGQSAAVGVISGCDASTNQLNGPGSCFYDADMRDIEQPFDDAYVEFIGRREGSGAVPYVHWASAPDWHVLHNFQLAWFQNKGAANYLHLIGAENYYGDQITYGGDTLYDPTTHLQLGATFVWVREQDLKWGSGAPTARRYTTVHELTHNFSLYGYSLNTYHCSNSAYSPPDDSHGCIMNGTYTSYTDSAPRFCAPHLCTGGSSLTEVGTSIRNQQDPLPY